MESKTHYEPVETAREKPETTGLKINSNPESREEMYYEGDGVWTNGSGRQIFPTHWLRPRPDTVLMTREEVEKVVRAAFEAGYNYEYDYRKKYPDMETYINNLFK